MQLFYFVMICCLLSATVHAQNDSISELEKLNKLSLEELMSLDVITASGVKQKIAEAASTISVITSQQIQERGYEQLEDVLRDLTGVDLIHIHGRASTFITFRGMYGDENRRMLFMIDGIVENNVMGDFAIAGPAYSLYNVDRIEIIWGPGSALYGANAFSAVINIITKKGKEANGLHCQRGYGSYNTSTENILLGLKKSNVEFAVAGSLYNTDGPYFASRHPLYSNSYVKNAWSVNSNIIYTSKKNKTTLGTRMYKTPGGWGAPLASPTVILGLPDQGNLNSGKGGMLTADFNGTAPSLAETIYRTFFLQNEYTLNPKLSLFARVQYRESEMTNRTYVYLNSPGTTFFSKNISAYYANRTAGELSVNYSPAQKHQFSIGLQIYQDNLERGFREFNTDGKIDTINNISFTNVHATFIPRKYTVQNTIGTYIQYILNTTFLHKTNFTIGGRYDYNSVYGKTINPRIGITNQPGDQLTFKLLYGTAFRAPTNFELYTATTGVRIPNENLKPEKIQTTEANIIYAPLKILSVQLNLFHNELRDIIIQDVPVTISITQNQNAGIASINGIEAKMDVISTKSFSSFLNFTYQEGTQNDGMTKSQIPNIAKYKSNIGCSIYVAELFSLNIIENWVGDRSVVATNPVGKANGYFCTNVVLSSSNLLNKRINASITIRNLFNQKYVDPGARAADGNFYATLIEQPGINVLFKIGFSIL